MADGSAHVQIKNLLGGQAVPYWGCTTSSSPLSSSRVAVALSLSQHGTPTLAPTSLSIPVLSQEHLGSAPACVQEALPQQTLPCEAEFRLKEVIFVPEGMNPTLFFHFPAVLLFFFHLVPC